jgi:hypothetical protein
VLTGPALKSASGFRPRIVGQPHTLKLANELLLNVAKDVDSSDRSDRDCLALGGRMHDAVRSAAEIVGDLVAEIARYRSAALVKCDKDPGDGLTRAIAAVSARWGSERFVVI